MHLNNAFLSLKIPFVFKKLYLGVDFKKEKMKEQKKTNAFSKRDNSIFAFTDELL